MPITSTPYTAVYGPLSVAGATCQLWLDAADATTITYGSGSNVSQWNDKSGNGRNCINSLSSNYPSYSATAFNGRQTLVWNSAVQMYVPIPAGTFPTSVTMFVVFQSTSALSGYNGLISRANTTNNQPAPFDMVSIYASNFTYRLIGNGSGNYNFTNEADLRFYTSTPSIYMMVVNNTPSWTEYMNGTNQNIVANLSGAIYADTATQIQMNSRNAFTGNMSEVLMYSSVLTTPQRQQIEGYLAQKWGLTSQLPPGHPGFTQTFYNSKVYQSRIPLSPQPIYQNFNPLIVGGCQIWLDGADTSTVTFSSGSNVSQWRDKSGNGLNATVYAGTPTYTSALGMTFNGSSSLQITYTASPTLETLFVIIKFTSVAAQADIFSGTAAGQREYLMYVPYSPGTIYLGRHSTAPSGAINGGTVTTSTNYMLGYVFNGTANTVSFYQQGNTSTSGTPQFTYSAGGTISVIGSYNGGGYLQGQIYELLVYNTALSSPQRQQVEGYLASKWGLQSSLDASNPYKNVPPGLPWESSVTSGLTRLPPIVATGGTITFSGSYKIHTFTTVGTTNFVVRAINDGVSVQVLVVGGGGGGGVNCAGGGGAGGAIFVNSQTVTSGSYSIVVGTGGGGGINLSAPLYGALGSNGGNSTGLGFTGIGGGGGGYSPQASQDHSVINGIAGGCGGGGAAGASGGSPLQAGGFAGGNAAFGDLGGGGGGGMGSVGSNGSGNIAGSGGNGATYTIGGTAYTLAGGGGGGSAGGSTTSSGGSGGGGAGAQVGNTSGSNATYYGSGGGGGAGGGGAPKGGDGFQGIVIIAYNYL